MVYFGLSQDSPTLVRFHTHRHMYEIIITIDPLLLTDPGRKKWPQVFVLVVCLSSVGYFVAYTSSDIQRLVVTSPTGHPLKWRPLPLAHSQNLKVASSEDPLLYHKPQTTNSSGKPMWVSHYAKGRLGNRLFQYAALYGIARLNNMSAFVPKSSKLGKVSPHLELPKKKIPSNWMPVVFHGSMTYNSAAAMLYQYGQNIVLDGYFCSWKYFDSVPGQIRKQFIFADKYLTKVNSFLTNVSTPASNLNDSTVYIGVHVRRGDILKKKVQNKGYILSDIQYFERAILYFERKYSSIVFIVCSDDKKWVMKNVKSAKSTVIYSPFKDAESDMCLLSQCNHTIISVGTFGWWGGWLAGGEVIYDKRFPRPGSRSWEVYKQEDYYPADWIGL